MVVPTPAMLAEPSAQSAGATGAARGWVWVSSLASVESQVPSLLAILEALLAMGVYAVIAVRWGTLHLTVAACIAPLLLLRTPDSVERGLRLFDWLTGTEFQQAARTRGLIYSVGAWAIGIVTLWGSPLRWWQTFIVLTIIAPTVQTIVIKVYATFRAFAAAPVKGIQAIPGNWWTVVACTDSRHPPELLPGALRKYASTGDELLEFHAAIMLSPALLLQWIQRYRTTFGNPLQIFRAYAQILISIPRHVRKAKTWRERALFLWGAPMMVLSFAMLPATLLTLLMAALPAWMYRWSLKGTSLLLSPLVWAVQDAEGRTPESVRESKYFEFVRWYSLAVLAILSVKVSTLVGLDPGKLLPEQASAAVAIARSNTVLAAFLAPGDLPWWQVLMAANALLSFCVYWYADRLKLRGYDEARKRVLDCGFAMKGALAAATVFGLVTVSASVIRVGSFPWLPH